MKTTTTTDVLALLPTDVDLDPIPGSIEALLELGSENIQYLIRQHRRREKELRGQMNKKPTEVVRNHLRMVRSVIGKLEALKRKAEKKPVFPRFRSSYEHFKEGDPVICFVGDWPTGPETPKKLINLEWVHGTMRGQVSFIGTRYGVRYALQVHDGGYLDGHGGDYFVVDPHVLHVWEYDYLASHPEYLRMWANHSADYARTPPHIYYSLRGEQEA